MYLRRRISEYSRFAAGGNPVRDSRVSHTPPFPSPCYAVSLHPGAVRVGGVLAPSGRARYPALRRGPRRPAPAADPAPAAGAGAQADQTGAGRCRCLANCPKSPSRGRRSAGWSPSASPGSPPCSAIGLVVGAQTRHESYAVVIFGVQVLFVGGLGRRQPPARTPGRRPPSASRVAIGTDVAAVLTRPASLAPLGYVTAAGLHPRRRRPARPPAGGPAAGHRVARLVAGRGPRRGRLRQPDRPQPAAARAPRRSSPASSRPAWRDPRRPPHRRDRRRCPGIAPQVPRGGAGRGPRRDGRHGRAPVATATSSTASAATGRRAAGLATALVAVVVDLSVGYAEAGRRMDGEEPALWLARHIQGPLAAFAFAAPAAYVAECAPAAVAGILLYRVHARVRTAWCRQWVRSRSVRRGTRGVPWRRGEGPRSALSWSCWRSSWWVCSSWLTVSRRAPPQDRITERDPQAARGQLRHLRGRARR